MFDSGRGATILLQQLKIPLQFGASKHTLTYIEIYLMRCIVEHYVSSCLCSLECHGGGRCGDSGGVAYATFDYV